MASSRGAERILAFLSGSPSLVAFDGWWTAVFGVGGGGAQCRGELPQPRRVRGFLQENILTATNRWSGFSLIAGARTIL